MKFRAITAGALISLLAGCASQPKLAPLMQMPPVPAPDDKLVEVDVRFENNSDAAENAVQLAAHRIAPSSSVVINVPEGLFETKAQSDVSEQSFKTKDFFNLAEQQIERELIRNGFRVLSRSKFEAKLRSLRDETRCDLSRYRCLHSQVAPEVKPILEELERKHKKGLITASDYADQISEFRAKLQVASAGRTRKAGERELTDISEVIRAAETGDVRADYILQINLFDIDKVSTQTADLRHNKQVREFIRDYPEIKTDFDRNSKISCAVAQANLNAKLVHVATGEIAWIGEHRLNGYSAGSQNVTVEFGRREYVANQAEVRRFVQQQNTETARLARFNQDVKPLPFDYQISLIKPTISAGHCESDWTPDSETKAHLARQVAKELITTIHTD